GDVSCARWPLFQRGDRVVYRQPLVGDGVADCLPRWRERVQQVVGLVSEARIALRVATRQRMELGQELLHIPAELLQLWQGGRIGTRILVEQGVDQQRPRLCLAQRWQPLASLVA